MLTFEVAAKEAPLPSLDRPGSGTGPRAKIFKQAAILLLLAGVAVCIDGYHPYGEDAGIYGAGTKHAIDPRLYAKSVDFVTPYARLSWFSGWNAALVRMFHLRLDTVLFITQMATVWLLLAACWGIGRRCFLSERARWGSVALTAFCLSIPVAGTSLFLMDPYVTGRSFSTPFSLLALCSCLDKKLIRTIVFLALAAVVHPLMAVYAAGFVLVLLAVQERSWAGLAILAASAIAAGEVVQYSQRNFVESAAQKAAACSRTYYYLSRWQWYEIVGLAAPLLLLGVLSLWRARWMHEPGLLLARSGVAVGVISITTSLLFARVDCSSHIVAALQTLRPFLILYFILFLLLGGLIAEMWLKAAAWRWLVFFSCLACGLAFVQHATYPSSAQVELPWAVNRNGWNRAFVWVRGNTPLDALVALDADYINAKGEDAQGFRAIAERSSLADSSKDGGVAAAFPRLADRWMAEQTATTGLSQMDDAERRRRLIPFGVSWMVLEKTAMTRMPCPFEDDLVKVCQLR